jgi:hypothetical protein
MYNKLSIWEYAQHIEEANNRISTDGFVCAHNNGGWLGYYIFTPKGNEYHLVKKSLFGDDGYYLCEYSDKAFTHGRSLGIDFSNLEECKKYLLYKEV